MADEKGTQTQPRPNISTENHLPGDAPPTKTQSRPNLSTEHQKPGDARRPRDTLDSENDAAHRAKDFDPAEDVGKAEPSGDRAD